MCSAQTAPDDQLCSDYHEFEYPEAKGELKRRHALTEVEWKLVEQHQIRIGISELALICSWGETEVNRTVTAHIIHKQYVYGGGSYVYVENGRVVSAQDAR